MKKNFHTDMRFDIKLWQSLPEKLRIYVYLMRLDRPIGVWLLLLPALWSIVLAAGGPLSMNGGDWKILCLFVIGAVVMRGAGCVINDLWDRNLDKSVERTQMRPLAKGDMSVLQGALFLTGLLLVGLVILLQLNLVTILLGILSLPLIIVYPLMKRITWWPQAFLGITFNFGALMGWSAISGILEVPALLFYVGGIFWTLGYDTIYAHQDKEDDMLVGIKSSALKLGDRARRWVFRFYALAFGFFAGGFYVASDALWTVFCILPALLYCGYMLKSWQAEDHASTLETFKNNRNIGLLILLGVVLATI